MNKYTVIAIANVEIKNTQLANTQVVVWPVLAKSATAAATKVIVGMKPDVIKVVAVLPGTAMPCELLSSIPTLAPHFKSFI